jgi:hypothetical protein
MAPEASKKVMNGEKGPRRSSGTVNAIKVKILMKIDHTTRSM